MSVRTKRGVRQKKPSLWNELTIGDVPCKWRMRLFQTKSATSWRNTVLTMNCLKGGGAKRGMRMRFSLCVKCGENGKL